MKLLILRLFGALVGKKLIADLLAMLLMRLQEAAKKTSTSIDDEVVAILERELSADGTLDLLASWFDHKIKGRESAAMVVESVILPKE